MGAVLQALLQYKERNPVTNKVSHLSCETFEGHFNVRSASVCSVSQDIFFKKKIQFSFALLLKAVCDDTACWNGLNGLIE